MKSVPENTEIISGFPTKFELNLSGFMTYSSIHSCRSTSRKNKQYWKMYRTERNSIGWVEK